jgi:hypothetical protein
VLTVVYLIHSPMGPELASRFARSYLRHPAGREHELLLALKGWEPCSPALVPFRHVPHRILPLPDKGFDIFSYRQAAHTCRPGRLLFLNTASEILADDWLAKLDDALSLPRAGAVAATGSSESHYTNTAAEQRVSPRHVRTFLRRELELLKVRREFYPFPNDHLRTNAFMLDRALFLSLKFPDLSTKQGSLLFESGRVGMTAQLRALGYRCVVVGRDGKAYPAAEWAASRTFRSGAQENLLIADNRTREYEQGRSPELARLAWGG